jgi:hypothetical protein
MLDSATVVPELQIGAAGDHGATLRSNDLPVLAVVAAANSY